MGIQPRWKEPEYTKREINQAGEIIRNPDSTDEEIKKARMIIDNWRASHAYPLHVFYMNLRSKAGNRHDIIVAERLKRLDSIIDKLSREHTMELYRMQDLGGCRMVLPSLREVYTYSEMLKNSKIRHIPKNPKDYINKPKLSGYRSLHHIYKFRTESAEKSIFNEYPMLIEIQFRTHLQHVWATAVESFSVFSNQSLKSGKGDVDVRRFFALVSSLFALNEGTPTVPGTPENQMALIEEIKQLNNTHHILDRLRAIRTIIDHETDQIQDKKGYYILQLDYRTHKLRRKYFRPGEAEQANSVYEQLEAGKDTDQDIVLVRAASFSIVKVAYPNYFMDIGEFVELITEYLQ